MGERRALVIGSQCDGLPNLPLPFLPALAAALFEVLTDPERGGCVPARSRLVLNPELAEMATAVNEAVAAADADEATLVVAFIGHAEAWRGRLFLLPRNGTSPPTLDFGFLLGERLAELIGGHSNIDGLVLLVDACQSGVGVADLARRAGMEIAEAGARVQLLTATFEQAARDGCFTRHLHALLRDGLADLSSDYLRADDLAARIAEACPMQEEPRLAAFQGHWQISDPGLWLARNVQATRHGPFKPGTPEAGLVDDVARWFQPTESLRELVGTSLLQQLVIVEGEAGRGKSALSAAVADPHAAGIAELGIVPSRFVHALVFASLAPTPQAVATALNHQLSNNVDGFISASEAYRAGLTEEQAKKEDKLTLEVVGPLRRLHQDRPHDVTSIGIIFDGWYQLATEVKQTIAPLLRELSGPDFTRVRLVVTTRPPVDPPLSGLTGTRLRVRAASNQDLGHYFHRREVAGELHEHLIDVGRNSWLLARVLADIATRKGVGRGALVGTLSELYAAELTRVADFLGADQLRPVLSVLATSRTGPVLPLSLLTYATGRLGGSDQPAHVRNVLCALEGLVVRAQPGTEQEQVGLFHDSLGEYLEQGSHATPSGAVNVKEGHRSIIEAIDSLVPARPRHPNSILRNYADRYHAEHLWELGQYSNVLAVLEDRQMQRRADNRDIWQRFLKRAEAEPALGRSHPLTLQAARATAKWTGLAGDYAEAVHLLSHLKTRCERAGQPTETSATQRELAHWRGMLEGPGSALETYLQDPEGHGSALEPYIQKLKEHWSALKAYSQDPEGPESALESYWQQHVVPAKTREPLEVWWEIAHCIGELGRPADAVWMLNDQFLLKMDEVVGSHDPATFNARHELGRWMAEAGGVKSGLEQLERLLEDQQPFTPDYDIAVLRTRHSIAYLTGDLGRPREAVKQFKALLDHYERLLESTDPEILMLRHNRFHWIGQSGNVQAAWRGLKTVLADQEKILPADHRNVLATRQRLAYYKGQAGLIKEALDDLRELRECERTAFPVAHVHSFRTRQQIANWTGEAGRPSDAEQQLRALLEDADASRGLPSDHPDIFGIRSDWAHWIGQAGAASRARRLLEELQKDMGRAPFIAGQDDRRLIMVTQRLAFWTGESGDPTRAVAILEKLLARAQAVLSEDVLRFAIERNLAHWIGQAGDPEEARRRLEDLLGRQSDVLGADNPDTLFTRQRLAFYYGETGNISAALQRSRELLEDQIRLLGKEHPDTLRTRRHIARWTGEADDPAEACRLLQVLLHDQNEVLGASHPHTLRTRHDLAIYTMRSGHPKAAWRKLEKLRRDEEVTLGPNHPATLRTLRNLAESTAQCGDIPDALRKFRNLLEKRASLEGFAPNHPDIRRTRERIEFWEARWKGDSLES